MQQCRIGQEISKQAKICYATNSSKLEVTASETTAALIAVKTSIQL